MHQFHALYRVFYTAVDFILRMLSSPFVPTSLLRHCQQDEVFAESIVRGHSFTTAVNTSNNN